jgi:phosphoglycolate phosphatase
MQQLSYNHIVWDWNGTLFDDAWLCQMVINQLLADRNLPQVNPDEYATIFGFPVITYYEKLGFNFNQEPFESISTAFVQSYNAKRAQCQLRDEALNTLNLVSDMGISQSILSASQQSSLDEVVAEFELTRFFGQVCGIDNHHAHGKVDIGQQWLLNSNLEPSQILLVGDTIHDYEVAQVLGIDCWLMPSGHQSTARLATCGVPVIETFDALIDSLTA